MPANLQAIKDALNTGDKKTAQSLLRPLLKDKPTADLWVLAAKAANSNEQAIDFLRRALALDPFHNEANRLLFKLEGAKPLTEQEKEHQKEQQKERALPKVVVKEEDLPPLKKVRRKRPNWGRRLLILLLLLIFSASCTAITLNLVGVITGPVTAITVITGGPQPVTEVNGTPLENVSDAPMRVEASSSESAQTQDTNVLDPGYLHEYNFRATAGESYSIYVQFLSVTANRVSRNVAIVDPHGRNAAPTCQRDQILQGDNNVAYTCSINETGEWRVRILGRRGESVGVYFVGVQKFTDF